MMQLFVVESPLQLLNAVEARQYFSIAAEDALLVVLRGVSEKNQQQTLQLVERNEWADITELGETKRLADFLKGKRKIARWLQQKGSVEQVFIGDYRARFMRHLANSAGKKVILLDDGTATLAVADKRQQGVSASDKYQSSWRKYFNKRRIFGYQDQDIPALTYFTSFNITANTKDIITRHHYQFLREKLGHYQRSDSWYFIGCPIVDMGIVSETSYLRYLQLIADSTSDPVFYIPHRREDPEKVAMFARQLGWQVRSFDKPLELALIESDELPQGFLGLYSTALDNAVLLFGEMLQIKSYEIPPEDILIAERRKFTADVYQYYREHYQSESFSLIKI